ncbi:MAG: hypothetical protein SGI74_14275 [Oligoflexia bacterium]|nr:hypothetical protein [Oligoflexia bacterium]
MKKCLKTGPAALSLLVLFYLTGCATYPFETKGAQNAFYSGDYVKAAADLEVKSKEDGKDQVLYLLDRAMALQLMGNFKESEKLFIQVDKLTEVKDYTSVSTEAATLLTSDNIKQYKGEDFEKVLINAFNAINYVLENNYEDALVECRVVNHKLQKYVQEAKLNYEQNPFARYLSAIIWEASGKIDDAYIDYKKTFELTPDFPYLKNDLIKWAKRMGRTEDLKKWEEKYGKDVVVLSSKEEKKLGEVILLYQQGKSAVKRPHPNSHRFPKFYSRGSTTQQARIDILTAENKTELSQKIYSVSDVAIKTLDEAYAGIVAKRVAGVVAKEVVADQIRQKNELLGAVAWISMHVIDQADLRHWSTLPETIQIARLHVAPGTHTIKVVGLDASGNPSGEETSVEVNVAAGKKAFINWRSIK